MAHPGFPGPFPIFFPTGNNNNKTLMCLIPPGPLFLRRHRLTQLLSVSPTSQPTSQLCQLTSHYSQDPTSFSPSLGSSHLHLSARLWQQPLVSGGMVHERWSWTHCAPFYPLHVALASECFSQLHIDGAMLCQALRGLAASASCLPEPSPHAKWKP